MQYSHSLMDTKGACIFELVRICSDALCSIGDLHFTVNFLLFSLRRCLIASDPVQHFSFKVYKH